MISSWWSSRNWRNDSTVSLARDSASTTKSARVIVSWLISSMTCSTLRCTFSSSSHSCGFDAIGSSAFSNISRRVAGNGVGVGVDEAAGLLGGGDLTVGVDRLHQLVRQIAQRDACDLFELRAVVGGDAAVEPSET